MKVGMYIRHFPPTGAPLRVGTNKAVHGLATGLAAAGASVTVLCEGEVDSYLTTAAGYNIRSFRTRNHYLSFRIAPGLRKYLQQRQRPDLVVLNGIFHPAVFAMSRALLRDRTPYVVAPHGPYHPTLFRKNAYLKWPYWYLFERRMLRSARALQLLDPRHSAWSEQLGIRLPAIVTPNGFLQHDVPDEAMLEWRTRDAPRLLYWGRIDVQHKGLDILLQGFARCETTPAATLTLQGPDWAGEKDRLMQLIAELPEPQRVRVLPPEFDVPAAQIMTEYDIVCMVSRSEGFGLAALEAMLAARVLIVPVDAGIAPHVQASGCGIAIDPSPESLSAAIDTLLQQRAQWREMGMRGRRYALQHLQWHTIGSDVLDHYRKLVH